MYLCESQYLPFKSLAINPQDPSMWQLLAAHTVKIVSPNIYIIVSESNHVARYVMMCHFLVPSEC